MANEFDLHLPVFLPGDNRDWKEIAGIAKISEEGDIVIKLQDKNAALELVHMAQNNILLQLAFDYRMSAETIDKINKRNQEKP